MIQKRRSLFFPVLLVGLGVFLLLNNIGLIPGSFNEYLRVYWPLILILGGLDALYRRDGWVWPLVLLGLGTILLLGNLNYLPASALPLLAKIWPILLVAIGLDVAFSGRNSGWYALLRVSLGVLLVGMILWLAISTSTAGGLQQQDYQQNLEGAESSRVSLSIIAGRLNLQPGTNLDTLLAVSAELPRDTVIKPVYSRPQNGESTLRYEIRDTGMLMNASSSLYDFRLNPAIPISLDTELVVGELNLDLTGTVVNALKTGQALGQQEVHLPCERRATANLEVAVGDLSIYIPRDCDVRINLENGVAHTSFPAGYQRVGDQVTNTAALAGSGPLELTVEVAVGSVGIFEE